MSTKTSDALLPTRRSLISRLRNCEDQESWRQFFDVEELANPGCSDLEALWETVWQKNLIAAAMERVKRKVNAEHYQIFHLLIIKRHSPQKVASLLKAMPPAFTWSSTAFPPWCKRKSNC
jgi:hypothetical protein